MATKKRQRATFDSSRLTILAAGDEGPFREAVLEILASRDRLAKEAALQALVERPLADLRPALRTLYSQLDEDGAKHDPSAHLRANIVRVLLKLRDTRDADIGLRACDTYESSFGDDVTYPLRALGLELVAATAPDVLPYVAAEHVNDQGGWAPEPANTALGLLASSGHTVAVYQWLVSRREQDPVLIGAALELLEDSPPSIMARYLRTAIRNALDEPASEGTSRGEPRYDEGLLTNLADVVVKRELNEAYPALAAMMRARISDELYAYVALLLAGTNRAPLLAVLDDQMADLRRRPAIVAALRVRTTPEQEALLKRWEIDDD